MSCLQPGVVLSHCSGLFYCFVSVPVFCFLLYYVVQTWLATGFQLMFLATSSHDEAPKTNGTDSFLCLFHGGMILLRLSSRVIVCRSHRVH